MNISRPRRLQNRDYSSPGLYFVTVCTNFKRCIFGRVKNAKVEHSTLGRIAEECWTELPHHLAHIKLHEHVVMPNHVHGIVEILSDRLAQRVAPLQRDTTPSSQARTTPSLSIIVLSFKANVTRRAGVERSWREEIWQHNYYDRVIRDGQEFSNATRYIAENPLRWESQAKKFIEECESERNRKAQQAAPLQRDQA